MSQKFLQPFLRGFLSTILCIASKETLATPNPASVYCVEKGGSVSLEHKNGQYGICVFPDGKQCEEWAMFWGHCPTGGIAIEKDLTSEERYCLITGGVLLNNATSCKLFTGNICGLIDFYFGKCQDKF